MTVLRSALPSVARLAALALLASTVTLSAASVHTMCAAAKHDCGAAALVAACCCGSNTEATRAAGPVVAVVRITPPAPSTTAAVLALATPDRRPLPLTAGPARAIPDDLTILLANLRI